VVRVCWAARITLVKNHLTIGPSNRARLRAIEREGPAILERAASNVPLSDRLESCFDCTYSIGRGRGTHHRRSSDQNRLLL